jgi:hypothetical protein
MELWLCHIDPKGLLCVIIFFMRRGGPKGVLIYNRALVATERSLVHLVLSVSWYQILQSIPPLSIPWYPGVGGRRAITINTINHIILE